MRVVLTSVGGRGQFARARMTTESVRGVDEFSRAGRRGAKKSFPSTDHLRWRDRSTAGAPKSATAPACSPRKSPFRSCPRFSQHRPVPPSTPPTERVRPSVERMLFLGRVPGAVFDRPVTGEHASLSSRLPWTASVATVLDARRIASRRGQLCHRRPYKSAALRRARK
uniref:Uncharacterized protein n=1 Tax=Plectus sambesii TaxID=2011161 RepID=A0A914WGC2_9BILA